MDDFSHKTGAYGAPVEGRGCCPVCSGNDLAPLVSFSTPRLCNFLFPTKEEAVAADIGFVSISYCRDCTHTFNNSFEEGSIAYAPHYDSSLEHSPRFAAFAEDLAIQLNNTYSLAGKTVVEIGCGKGDFLKRLCALSKAKGIGFDTSYEERGAKRSENITFVCDYFDERYCDIRPDFIVCRHVLEHIENPVAFLQGLRAHPGVGPHTCLYFEVPNALYTLRDHGIWDLIYEHASYFTLESLRTAFQLAGFDVLRVGASFSEQYLFVEARAKPPDRLETLDNSAATESLIASFAEMYRARIARWADRLAAEDPAKVVVWGAGSKGITFVNAVPGGGQIGAFVDVNPHKQGRFAPRYGTLVISPNTLKARGTKLVVIMNPIYSDEIARAAAAVAPLAEIMLA